MSSVAGSRRLSSPTGGAPTALQGASCPFSGPRCSPGCWPCRCSSPRTSCCCGARRRAPIRYASLSLMKEALGPGSALPPARPAAPVPARGDRDDHRDRPADGRHHPSFAAADHRAGDGRVAQHGRQGRRSQPPHGGADRRQDLHRRAPARCAHRHRVVRRDSVPRADADREPRGPPRRHRPIPAAARHRHRQRPLRRARDALSRRRHRPRIAGVQGRALQQLRADVAPGSGAEGRGEGSEARRARLLHVGRRSSC